MVRIVLRFCCAVSLALGLLACPVTRAMAGQGGSLFTIQLLSHGGSTRITLGLIRPLPFHAMVDAGTERLAVDFDALAAIPGASVGRGSGLVRTFHAEPSSGGGIRLVFDLAGPAVITSVRAVASEAGRQPQAVVELASASFAEMRSASGTIYRPQGQPVRMAAIAAAPSHLDPPGPLTLRPPETDRISTLIAQGPVALPPEPREPESRENASPQPLRTSVPPIRSRGITSLLSPKRVIVIDPGHGGIDPGAESIAGYHEKEVTLATARALRRVLEETGRYKVVLTRDSDIFLKLHERVALARTAHGDLFISLHADSMAGAGLQSAADRMTRGASIYTLSETASDAESERYAQRENRADAIGGIDLGDQSDDVAGILVDLTVRETVNEGNRFAGMLVDSLEHDGIALLPHTPHRAAGFAVLKAPDIPSVLIEMGYLSDISDSRALADPRHQLQVARGIADGIDRYFAWVAASRP